MFMLMVMNDEGYQHQLEALRIEHRDMDDAIQASIANCPVEEEEADIKRSNPAA